MNDTLDPFLNPEEWRRYFAVTQDSLRAIAEQSGGRALLRQEDFVGGFGQINAAMRR